MAQLILISKETIQVYRIITSGHHKFDAIKAQYLANALQLSDLTIPKAEIQDGALHLILMSLMESKLIMLNNNSEYDLVKVIPDLSEEMRIQVHEAYLDMIKKREIATNVQSRIFEVLETEAGKYTIDSLHRYLSKSQLNLEYEVVNLSIRARINSGEIALDENNCLILGPKYKIVASNSVRRSISNPTQSQRPFSIKSND